MQPLQPTPLAALPGEEAGPHAGQAVPAQGSGWPFTAQLSVGGYGQAASYLPGLPRPQPQVSASMLQAVGLAPLAAQAPAAAALHASALPPMPPKAPKPGVQAAPPGLAQAARAGSGSSDSQPGVAQPGGLKPAGGQGSGRDAPSGGLPRAASLGSLPRVASQGSLRKVASQGSSLDQAGGSSSEQEEGGPAKRRRTKKPRLVWTSELHQRFLNAVYHLGVQSAVPKTILQLMNVEGMTRENVASHLQKFRQQLKRADGWSGPGQEVAALPAQPPSVQAPGSFPAALTCPPLSTQGLLTATQGVLQPGMQPWGSAPAALPPLQPSILVSASLQPSDVLHPVPSVPAPWSLPGYAGPLGNAAPRAPSAAPRRTAHS